MNENAKKWVEALRSGKYKQGQGYLRFNDKFCCLGVACDVAIENGLCVKVDSANKQIYYGGEVGILPQIVSDWLGMRVRTSEFDGLNQLTVENDNGSTFSEIADLIESEPKGLFV